jgi:hypothetical protein
LLTQRSGVRSYAYEEVRGYACSVTAYVSIRQHTSAYVSIRQRMHMKRSQRIRLLRHRPHVSIHQHTSEYVSIRQHTSTYVSMRQHTPAYASIRQHTSAYVSVREHLLRHRPHALDSLSRIVHRRQVSTEARNLASFAKAPQPRCACIYI